MPTKKLKFHEAMNRLDEIVTELNRDDLELEKAMDLFTEGTKLTAQCETQLKEFEQKVEQLSNQKETTND
ncbi:exodeoxyribonuclease VII small subunit [Absicoccus porci]|jgi:exodeoxyribonuclease VII small subunit|uniref:exodeoxyribonuclease VII small subunit n=1 Tax=Absicoccus porci TaxID=2486576 RepID=UPI003D902EF7